jgi:hypothetical protein
MEKKFKQPFVIEQYDENRFVIELREVDEVPGCTVVHDYISLTGFGAIPLDKKLQFVKNSEKFSTNYVAALFNIHISIYDWVMAYLPMIKQNEYCQLEHIVRPEGKFAYTYSDSLFKLYHKDSQKTLYYKRKAGESNYEQTEEKDWNLKLTEEKKEKEEKLKQTLKDLQYALNQIPNQRNVGPKGESSYDLASQLDTLIKDLP